MAMETLLKSKTSFWLTVSLIIFIIAYFKSLLTKALFRKKRQENNFINIIFLKGDW